MVDARAEADRERVDAVAQRDRLTAEVAELTRLRESAAAELGQLSGIIEVLAARGRGGAPARAGAPEAAPTSGSRASLPR
ncbi:MAG: hypothetical protein PGN11_10540 [Quadrisphaera sp.]